MERLEIFQTFEKIEEDLWRFRLIREDRKKF